MWVRKKYKRSLEHLVVSERKDMLEKEKDEVYERDMEANWKEPRLEQFEHPKGY